MYKFFNGSFYSYALEDAYRISGTWPDSGVDIDENTFISFMTAMPDKNIGTAEDGSPVWQDIPTPAESQYIADAIEKRELLLTNAMQAIVIWQAKLFRGRQLNKTDEALLDLWLDYIDQLEAVNTNLAPNISWPESPKI